MSHIIRSRPAVAAVFRMLPAPLDQLIQQANVTSEHVRNAVKLLMATKKAYCQGWTADLQPIIAAGHKTNVPRPTPEMTEFIRLDKRRAEYPNKRAEYQAAYREANREKRNAYMAANKDHMNKKRNERMALKRALAAGVLVAKDEAPKTQWRAL